MNLKERISQLRFPRRKIEEERMDFLFQKGVPARGEKFGPKETKSIQRFVDIGEPVVPPKRKLTRKEKILGARQKLAQETPKVKDVKINPTEGRQVANAFDKIKHEPNNPKVKSAYGAFIKETNQQFKELQGKGFKFSQSKPGSDAYPSSDAMNKDIARKQLKYFPTSRGFGRNAQKFQDHPLLKMSPFKDAQGNRMTNNDTFRVVHDVNGHNFGEPADFSFAGEEQAFRTHKQFYGKQAQKALFTETAGQANWGTFSREFGASNRRNPANMVFSEQKAGLFPQSIINKRFHI